ncbi:MAG: hypothetical protein GKR89_28410 [Candidatus Latescibacteria bacterium]|nr:hypothetical protein [Candidatus Latescibacterota bacterium]
MALLVLVEKDENPLKSVYDTQDQCQEKTEQGKNGLNILSVNRLVK